MKRIKNVAAAELKHLFYSPVAWIASAVLLLIFAVDYVRALGWYQGIWETGGKGLVGFSGLTIKFTINCPLQAIFTRLVAAHGKYVFPFIFLGIISREYSSGSIKLILSSPVKIKEFVIGKFLGVAIFCALLVSLLGIVIFFGLVQTVGAADITLLTWQLICTYFYFLFFAAICLFASSLSKQSFVGGILSILFIIVFGLLNNIDQRGGLADYFYPLSHQAIALRLLSGGIDLNDVIMLLLFIFLFIQLTILRIQQDVTKWSLIKSIGRYGLVVLSVFAAIGLLPYMPLKYIDITRDRVNTTPDKIQGLLKKMDKGPLEVTYYINVIFRNDRRTEHYIPEGRTADKFDLWRTFMLHKKDIKINYRYYYAVDTTTDAELRQIYKSYKGMPVENIARIMADTYGYNFDELLTKEQVQKEIDLEKEDFNGLLIRIRYQGREEIIRSRFKMMPTDYQYYAAFSKVMPGEHSRMAFMMDGESLPLFVKNQRYLGNYLVKKEELMSWKNIGPDLDSIRLTRSDLTSETGCLVISSPQKPLDTITVSKIKRYIDSGGNVLLTGEPENTAGIAPLLDHLGVSFKKEIVIQPTEKMGSSKVLGFINKEAYRYLWNIDSLANLHKAIGVDTLNVVFDRCAALELDKVKGFDVLPLVHSYPEKSWNIPALTEYDSLYLSLPKRASDQNGSFPLIALLSRTVNGKQQRIIVSGDADFLTSKRWQNEFVFNTSMGYDKAFYKCFSNDLLSLLTDGRYPVNFNEPNPRDNFLKTTSTGVVVQRAVFVYILPALVLILGSILIIRRKQK